MPEAAMKTFFSLSVLFKIAILAVCSTLVTVPRLLAQQSPMNNEESQITPGAVAIHGHWIMDVVDKNGAIVDHRDFENSLVPTGSATLALALTGQLVYSSGFAVAVQDTTNSQIYELYNATYPVTPCGTTTGNGVPGFTYKCVTGLTQTFPSCIFTQNSTCTTGSTLVLQGSLTAVNPLLVASVQTLNVVCTSSSLLTTTPSAPQVPVGVSPSTCAAGNAGAFPVGVSTTTLPFTATSVAPLTVAAGQSLLVRVILSFS
jgi:hypothetical protein